MGCCASSSTAGKISPGISANAQKQQTRQTKDVSQSSSEHDGTEGDTGANNRFGRKKLSPKSKPAPAKLTGPLPYSQFLVEDVYGRAWRTLRSLQMSKSTPLSHITPGSPALNRYKAVMGEEGGPGDAAKQSTVETRPMAWIVLVAQHSQLIPEEVQTRLNTQLGKVALNSQV